MMLRIYEEADWPNMEERNTEGRKDGDRRSTATKCRHFKKATIVFNFRKKHTVLFLLQPTNAQLI